MCSSLIGEVGAAVSTPTIDFSADLEPLVEEGLMAGELLIKPIGFNTSSFSSVAKFSPSCFGCSVCTLVMDDSSASISASISLSVLTAWSYQ